MKMMAKGGEITLPGIINLAANAERYEVLDILPIRSGKKKN